MPSVRVRARRRQVDDDETAAPLMASIVRIRNPDQTRPSHAVLVALVSVILLGSCLLTCGSAMDLIPDGAVQWRADSLFRAVVELLNLNNSQPTQNGVEIKSLVFHIGSAVAVLIFGVAVAVRPLRGEESAGPEAVVEIEPDRDKTLTVRRVVTGQISALTSAQVLMLLYVAWSFASTLWSNAPGYALGTSGVLAMHLFWSYAIGLGLNRTAARAASYALIVAAVATSVLAILYRVERNPTLRASYPIGNPIFLAACLLPGLVLSGGLAWTGALEVIRRRRYPWLIACVAGLASAVAIGWAFRDANSRGPLVGLVLAVVAVVFLAMGRRGKTVVGALALGVALLAAAYVYHATGAASLTGRSASIRARLYAWKYAVALGCERKSLGHGQGGFVLKGDALAEEDVLGDPEALEYPIRHVHNEFLEVWADLGSAGLVLLVGGLALTLAAAVRAIPTLPSRSLRWALIGLAASLVGLLVEELSSPGLRLPGVPTVFYTALGLVWAMSAPPGRGAGFLERTTTGRKATLCAALGLSGGAAMLSIADFEAARRLYEVPRLLMNQEWDLACRDSDSAYRWRLLPERRLQAAEARCQTRADIASYFQASSLRRLDASRQVGQRQAEQLLLLSNQDAAQALLALAEGYAALRDLTAAAPNCWNSGWLEYRLRQVEMEFAAMRADEQTAAHLAEVAAKALERELRRRPFEPGIALPYASLMEGKLSLDQTLELLARPLRYRPVPPEYFQYFGYLAQTDGFRDRLAAQQAREMSAVSATRAEDWASPVAPERLVLCAVAVLAQHRYAEAVQPLQAAIELYPRLPSVGVGLATSHALLADARFLQNPNDPLPAIQEAEAVLRVAPPSHLGRQIIDGVHARLVAYHLAAGHEDFVRSNLLPPLMSTSKPEAVTRELGARYFQLCQSLLTQEPPLEPANLGTWLDRAIELNPSEPSAWLAKAELAIRGQSEAQASDVLRQALEAGVDPRAVFSFVQPAVQGGSGGAPMLQVWRLLHERYGAPPAPTSQPADVTSDGLSPPSEAGTSGS